MRSIKGDRKLKNLADRIIGYATDELGMVLPEIRFFILDPLEFASLLEKNVFPSSPVNIWEGKRLIQKKHNMANGFESALYYEVVQTGNPSYAYLNETNSTMTQASVMAHVLGHCEFSELNVLGDSDDDRTEYVMYLTNKVALARRQMGERRYLDYWNACESMIPLIAPNSQYNLRQSVELESQHSEAWVAQQEVEPAYRHVLGPISDSLNALFASTNEDLFDIDDKKRQQREDLSLHGYRLAAPCEDVAGFLREHAPTSSSEQAILDYFYYAHQHQDFVRRTQIMNEGWAMYWEKKIMLQLFSEHAISGIIDYSKIFSGVCYPRPWFARNPYHLGFHLWLHIEELFRKGRHSLEYQEEVVQDVKAQWDRPDQSDPIARMRHIVKTVTDYEFLRRFLTPELVSQFHLNRISRQQAAQIGIQESDAIDADQRWVWIDPEPIPEQMLEFFTHFYRPRIYVVDNDFRDGGLLLLHRDDGSPLRPDWIQPTLNNLHHIWKGPVYLTSQNELHAYRAEGYSQQSTAPLAFEVVRERMSGRQKAFAGAEG